MKVFELMSKLSNYPSGCDVELQSVVNADELSKGEDWSEDENFRDITEPINDVYWVNGSNKVVIHF